MTCKCTLLFYINKKTITTASYVLMAVNKIYRLEDVTWERKK